MDVFWIIVGKVLQNPTLGSNLPIFAPLNGNISHAIHIFGDLGIQFFSVIAYLQTVITHSYHYNTVKVPHVFF